MRLLLYQQCYAHIKFCTVHIEDAATSQWIPVRLHHKRSKTYRCVFQTVLIFNFYLDMLSLHKKPHIVQRHKK